MNVSKPRPNDHPLLVLFIVGGITCSEVHQIREALAAYHPNTQVSNNATMLCLVEPSAQAGNNPVVTPPRPPGWDASSSQGYPSITFMSVPVYTSLWREAL